MAPRAVIKLVYHEGTSFPPPSQLVGITLENWRSERTTDLNLVVSDEYLLPRNECQLTSSIQRNAQAQQLRLFVHTYGFGIAAATISHSGTIYLMLKACHAQIHSMPHSVDVRVDGCPCPCARLTASQRGRSSVTNQGRR